MNHDDRDERLGAALRSLPVPDHAPGFWDDLADRLAGEDASPVVRLGDERRARRRLFVPVGAAAAVVATLLGAGLMLNDSRDPGRQVVADRPEEPAGAGPAMITVGYSMKGRPELLSHGSFSLTLANNGSFRWTAEDGSQDIAFSAPDRQATRIGDGFGADGGKAAYVTTDVPPGGPDQRIARPEPLGPVADFVVSLARAGDERVIEATHAATGRGVWRYDGPVVQDRLAGRPTPDRIQAEVDRTTGILLALHSDDITLAATSVDTAGEIDHSRFRIEIPPSMEHGSISVGFQATSLDEARRQLPYPVLVPEAVPDGYELDTVAVNRAEPSATGAEGMNPPVANIVAMTWRQGFFTFTVTLRPVEGQEWADPFGAEGMVFKIRPVEAKLPGRPPLAGELVVDAPAPPHLWGITPDLVVTADGDLSADELRRLAESLRA